MSIGWRLPGTKPEHGKSDRARYWRIFWSYLPDWILTIFLWGILYLFDKVDGYRRLFSVTDTSLAHPYATHERVKVSHLAVYAGVIPAVLIALTGGAVRRSLWDVHSGILGLILSLGLVASFTTIIKVCVGRPRPDLFDRCQLPADYTSNPVHGLTSWTVCTRTDLLQEGFRSFPSGHSSFAWSGLWYLILYGAAKMGVSNRRGYTWKSWILLAPLIGACLISISRTMDYRHHSTDVIAGAIIGILGAWYAYRQYHPPLYHPQAYKPYSPRIPRTDEIPLHNLDRDRSSDRTETASPRRWVDNDQSSGLSPIRPIDLAPPPPKRTPKKGPNSRHGQSELEQTIPRDRV